MDTIPSSLVRFMTLSLTFGDMMYLAPALKAASTCSVVRTVPAPASSRSPCLLQSELIASEVLAM